MKEQLFRKVKCSDRLPKETNIYLAYDEDIDYWEQIAFSIKTRRWGTVSNITHWLEPIEPTTKLSAEKWLNANFIWDGKSPQGISLHDMAAMLEDYAKYVLNQQP